MRRIGTEAGFSFHKTYKAGCSDQGMESVRMQLESAGIGNICLTFQNVLTATRKKVKWIIFDAGYSKSKNSAVTFIATLLQAEIPEELPQFTITPRPDNDAKHGCSKRYELKSDDPRTKRVVTNKMRSAVSSLPVPCSIQAGGHLLQFHMPIDRAPPEQLITFFNEAEKITAMIRARA